MPKSPLPPSLILRNAPLASLASFFLVLCSFVLSTSRQLNFDEWLALRSGWLLFNSNSFELHFLMPYTWLIGLLERILQTPSTIIYTTRTIAVASILSCLWWAFKRHTPTPQYALTSFLICLTSGAFLSHAFEIRYDTVIITLWLLAFGILNSAKKTSTKQYAFIGAIIAALALHHTKGMFYSLSLLTYVLLTSPQRWRTLITCLVGSFFVFIPWLYLLITNNLIEEQLAIYFQFSNLAQNAERVPPWSALKERVLSDLSWWIVVLPLAITGIYSRLCKNRFTNLWFLLTPIFFILLHPRPWDYLIAPSIPSFALLASTGGATLVNHMNSIRSSRIAITAISIALANVGLTSFQKALSYPHLPDSAALDLLKTKINKIDRVLDPVGAAFFVQPVEKQWYLDTLFKTTMTDEQWMTNSAQAASASTVVITSYRLHWLPNPTLSIIEKNFEQACGWLWLRRNDPRIAELKRECPQNIEGSLANYWGR